MTEQQKLQQDVEGILNTMRNAVYSNTEFISLEDLKYLAKSITDTYFLIKKTDSPEKHVELKYEPMKEYGKPFAMEPKLKWKNK